MNPFIVSGFEGPEYFCDRKKELRKLKEAFDNRRNVTMFSLRRMGKSALVKYHFERISKQANCIFVDLFPAQSFEEFTELFARSVTEQMSRSGKRFIDKILSLVKSMGATLSFNSQTGAPEISFGLSRLHSPKSNLEDLVYMLEENKKRTVVAFDEFQVVRNFSDKNAEANLRSVIQNLKYVNFIFLGSNKSIMDSIFSDSKKPFYQSTQHFMLEEIEGSEYEKFIIEKFKSGKMIISKKDAGMILDLCKIHTYYVQYVCNRIYSKSQNVSGDLMYEVINEVLEENEPVYINYKNLLTTQQWKLLAAISKESNLQSPLSIGFIKKYDLNSASSVKRSLDSLLKKEIVIKYKEKFQINDLFFSLWLKKKIL